MSFILIISNVVHRCGQHFDQVICYMQYKNFILHLINTFIRFGDYNSHGGRSHDTIKHQNFEYGISGGRKSRPPRLTHANYHLNKNTVKIIRICGNDRFYVQFFYYKFFCTVCTMLNCVGFFYVRRLDLKLIKLLYNILR